MSPSRHAAALNTVGLIVLLVGLGSAVAVYRLGRKPPAAANPTGEWQDNTLSMTDSKTNLRDLELYGGKLEVLMVKFLDRLHRPESQAIIIAAISGLVALVCFLGAAGKRF